jgi:hypothetical protein
MIHIVKECGRKIVHTDDFAYALAASVLFFRGLRVGALTSHTIRGGRFTARSKGKDISGALPDETLAAIRGAGLDNRRLLGRRRPSSRTRSGSGWRARQGGVHRSRLLRARLPSPLHGHGVSEGIGTYTGYRQTASTREWDAGIYLSKGGRLSTMRIDVRPTMLAWALERSGIEPDALTLRFPKLPD